MTDGEKMVWAAVFAVRHHEISREQLHTHGGGRAEYDMLATQRERRSITDAAEAASIAVRLLREHAPEVREGWGEDSSTYLMLKEML